MLGPHTIERQRAARKPSDYGTTQVLDWQNVTTISVAGCSVQPIASSEYTTDRDSTTTRWVAYVPIDADIKAADRIGFDGATYDIDGDVERWLFGTLSHQVVNLKRSKDA